MNFRRLLNFFQNQFLIDFVFKIKAVKIKQQSEFTPN